MKLNDIGPRSPRVEQAAPIRPTEGPKGTDRLTSPSQGYTGNGVDGSPPPLRFPWLSRETQGVLEAAGRRSVFSAMPLLGDKLDTWT